MNIRARLSKLEQRRSGVRNHVVFGKSHEDVEAQRFALIRNGKALETDEFVMFVTIYEERPQ